MGVRRLLDLNTSYLRPHGADLNDDGVIAYDVGDHGWLMWVPGTGTDVTTMNEHNRDYPEISAELIAVQEYARSYGCDYVLFDADGPDDLTLPSWDW